MSNGKPLNKEYQEAVVNWTRISIANIKQSTWEVHDDDVETVRASRLETGVRYAFHSMKSYNYAYKNKENAQEQKKNLCAATALGDNHFIHQLRYI